MKSTPVTPKQNPHHKQTVVATAQHGVLCWAGHAVETGNWEKPTANLYLYIHTQTHTHTHTHKSYLSYCFKNCYYKKFSPPPMEGGYPRYHWNRQHVHTRWRWDKSPLLSRTQLSFRFAQP